MKVLTIKQSWATLIMQKDKRFEFRSFIIKKYKIFYFLLCKKKYLVQSFLKKINFFFFLKKNSKKLKKRQVSTNFANIK